MLKYISIFNLIRSVASRYGWFGLGGEDLRKEYNDRVTWSINVERTIFLIMSPLYFNKNLILPDVSPEQFNSSMHELMNRSSKLGIVDKNEIPLAAMFLDETTVQDLILDHVNSYASDPSFFEIGSLVEGVEIHYSLDISQFLEFGGVGEHIVDLINKANLSISSENDPEELRVHSLSDVKWLGRDSLTVTRTYTLRTS